MSPHGRKDIVALVADRNMEFAVQGLLSRHQSLNIRPVAADVFVHPERDPGCFLRGHDFLGPWVNSYHQALVLFDREGCGRDSDSRQDLELAVEGRLTTSGWGPRAAAVVIDPELEAWVWVNSPRVEDTLGWGGRVPDLRTWLREQGMLAQTADKPSRPKEAVQEALRIARKPRSSALYLQLAQGVTLDDCTDPAFRKLRGTLAAWFGTSGQAVRGGRNE